MNQLRKLIGRAGYARVCGAVCSVEVMDVDPSSGRITVRPNFGGYIDIDFDTFSESHAEAAQMEEYEVKVRMRGDYQPWERIAMTGYFAVCGRWSPRRFYDLMRASIGHIAPSEIDEVRWTTKGGSQGYYVPGEKLFGYP